MSRLTESLPVSTVLLWIIVGAGCVVLALTGIRSHRLSDFAGYYTASRILVTEPDSLDELYNDRWFVQEAHRFGVTDSTFIMYVNPPPVSLVMLSVQWMEPLTAKLVWNSISLLLLGLAFFLAMRYFGLSAGAKPSAVLFGVMACTIPFFRNLQRGQAYILMLVLVLIVLTGLQRRSVWMTAVALTVLILLKYFGWLFLIYFAVRRRWKDVGVTVGLLVGGFVVCLVLFGVPAYTAHILTLVNAAGNHDFAFTGLPSVQALFGGLFTASVQWNPHPVADLPWLANMLTLASLVGALYLSVREQSADDRIEANLVLALSVIFTPLAADHHYVLMIPPLFMALHETGDKSPVRFFILAAAMYLVLGWDPTPSVRDYPGWSKILCFPRLYGAVGLWWLLSRYKNGRGGFRSAPAIPILNR